MATVGTLCSLIAFGTVLGIAPTPAQPTTRSLQFDVASIKVTIPTGRGGGGRAIGGPGTTDPGRYSVPVDTMVGLLVKAFDIENAQIIGPSWMRQVGANLYELNATMPPDTTKEQFRKMLQSLLSERFHLAVHHELRNFPGYELAIDSGGTKLKAVMPQADDGPQGSTRPDQVSASGGKITMKEQTMEDFAQRLGMTLWTFEAIATQKIDSPRPRVLDRTGLTGKYSLVMEFSAPAPGFTAAPDSPEADLPDLYSVLRKQLGLRLNKIQSVPVEVVVVDKLDQVPVEN